MAQAIKNRYDFVILFDVENGNPNGDPDAGNMPRVDPETGYGIVTDVCLKRKIRNYVEVAKEDEAGYQIYIKDQVPLNRSDKKALEYLGIDADAKDALKVAKKDDPELSFARSVDPVLSQEVTITRIAITTEADAERKGTEMGRKYVIPYGLYRAEGYISANLARKTTGFSEDDLQLLWQAILNMFENDHSAARGKMAVRELIVFKHDSELGNAPSYKLFDAVHVTRAEGVAFPRSYHDYVVTVDENLPAGVTCERLS